jgi:hypothetical protein
MKTKKTTKRTTTKPKARHTMHPAKRTTAKADAASNRHRARYGDRQDSPAVELHALLQQVAAGGGWMRGKKKKVNIQGDTAVVFAKKIWNIFESGDGAALRDFAALADAAVARPALEAAYAIRQDLEHYANEDRPRFKRAAIVRSIMSTTGCDQRTAEKATAEAGLKELFGWKAGRPRSRS